MDFRQIKKEDARAFYECMKAIDQETEYMLYEPDERVWNQDLLEGKIEREQDFLVGAFEEKEIVGFLSAERGTARRIQQFRLYCGWNPKSILSSWHRKSIFCDVG